MSGEDSTPRLLAATLDGAVMTSSTRATAGSVGVGTRPLATSGAPAGAAVAVSSTTARLTEGADLPPTALLLARAGLLESSSTLSIANTQESDESSHTNTQVNTG